MLSDDFASITVEAGSLLNARLLDSAASTCELDLDGTRIKLMVLAGPSGSYVSGRVELAPVAIDDSGKDILYAMYMNGTLHEASGLPLWFALDPEENRFLACFSLSTYELTAARLAETLEPLKALRQFQFPA